MVKFDVAFSGFADDTPWFLMGAILFGTMASKSGLAKRLAYLITIGIGTSYSRLLLALILSDFMLTFLVPSGMARVTVMAAVATGLISAFGLGPGSNVGRGMFLTLTYTAGVFDKSIIAGAAAITGTRHHRERRPCRSSVEPMAGGLSSLRHPHDFGGVAADIVALSSGSGVVARGHTASEG